MRQGVRTPCDSAGVAGSENRSDGCIAAGVRTILRRALRAATLFERLGSGIAHGSRAIRQLNPRLRVAGACGRVADDATFPLEAESTSSALVLHMLNLSLILLTERTLVPRQ